VHAVKSEGGMPEVRDEDMPGHPIFGAFQAYVVYLKQRFIKKGLTS
jgi:hypothetical protein